MDLRSSASGDRPRETAMPTEEGTPMTDLLTEHLAAVRMDMWSSMEQLMTLIKQRAEALQKESSHHLEADLAELRRQNSSLRDQLSRSAIEARTGGTGDTMPSHTPQSTVSRDRLQCASSLYGLRDAHGSQHTLEPLADMSREVSGGKKHDVRSAGYDMKSGTGMPARIQESHEADSRREAASRKEPPRHQRRSSRRLLRSDTAQRVFGGASVRESTPVNSGPPARSDSATEELTEDTDESRWSKMRKEFFKHGTKSRLFKDQASAPRQSTRSDPDHRGTVAVRKVPRHQKEGVFADAAAMKDRVRAALAKPEYNVSDFYWETGWCQAIARAQIFEYITLSVIAVNALWIAIDTDLNHQDLLLDADAVFQVAEYSFCTFFTFEWAVRFASFREKRNALGDGWFCFDSVLVVIMVIETWIFSLIFLAAGAAASGTVDTSVLKLVRLVRLTRMARMAKLLRAVPELIILIKGIWVAARSVFFTLVLLVIIIYVFAIVLRQLTDDSDIGAQYFPSVPQAMQSLLLDGVLPDQAVFVRDSGDSHVLLGIFLLLFILLSSLTVMNMLVGVLCEVVSVVSAVEKEQLTVNYVKQRLQSMFMDTDVDQDGSQSISKHEFEKILTNKEAVEIIQDMGVDVVGLVDFADIIFEDDIELSFADFMELVLQLRGSNNCTVKDMVDLRKFVVTELGAAEARTIEVICHILNYDTRKLQDWLGHGSAHKDDNHLEITSAEVDHIPSSRFEEQPSSGQLGTAPLATESELPGSVGLA